MRGLCAVLLLLSTAPVVADRADVPVDPELRDALRVAVEMADSFADRFDAEVWLTDMSARLARQVPDQEERMLILRLWSWP